MHLIEGTAKRICVFLLCSTFKIIIVQSFPIVDSKSVLTTTLPTSLESESFKDQLELNSTSPSFNASVQSIVMEAEGSSTKRNSTSSNYIVEYKLLVFKSPEDIKTQQEWGGNCTLKHWDQCKVLAKWFGKYEDPKDGKIKEYLIDCKEEPVVCLKNSWTVTRCNLLCMSRCNREIPYKYEKYVSHDGECRAHTHG